MTKILIIGTSCVGKSTLADKISQKLSLEHIDLDDLYWLPDWKVQSESIFIDQVQNICKSDKWVISGNYSKVQPYLIKTADQIIWLDYSMARILTNFIKRTSYRLFTNTTCCNGNRESLKKSLFSKNSLFIWIISTHKRRSKYYLELFESQKKEKSLYKFTHPNETLSFLNDL